MDKLKLLLLLGFAFMIIQTVVSFYQAFHSPRCPENSTNCFRPLFSDGESVDLWVYLTTDPKLKWWTTSGIEELERTPLWNATSVPFGALAAQEQQVTLPLSAPELQGVRANTSKLYAHCYLVRNSSSIRDTLAHVKKKPELGVLSANVLHTKQAVTRWLPQTKKARRNLLGNASDSDGEDSNGGVTNWTRDEAHPVFVTLPVLAKSVRVYPTDALMWTASAFIVTAFFTPGPYLAVARHVLLVAVAPWLVHQRQGQVEKYNVRLKEMQALEQEQWRLQQSAPVMPHLTPKVRIEIAADSELYDARYPPPLLYKKFDFGDGSSPMPIEIDVRYTVFGTGAGGAASRKYSPPFNVDLWGYQARYWRLLDSNASKEDPTVPVEIVVPSMIRYSVTETFKQAMRIYMSYGLTDRDLDELRDWLFRYPLHILALMQVIGVVQMFLTTMAFKNDITFFKGRSDYTGLSSRSLMTDTLQEITIFLYLFDYEDISRIILFQVGSSAVIGAWKYVRVARIGVKFTYMLPWFGSNRGTEGSQNEQSTDEIDAKGMKYLKYVLYPLSAAWGVYNLYHFSYKSWWSWLVSSLADFAYTFGFINMWPQIFINYKLKSVAHMPWRVLMYKFFNTFIDDVFAFVIMSDHMTKKHRWMTLRDDIVFFVFLYQLYIYKVDRNRPDEYGNVYTDAQEQKAVKEKEGDAVVQVIGISGVSRSDMEWVSKGLLQAIEEKGKKVTIIGQHEFWYQACQVEVSGQMRTSEEAAECTDHGKFAASIKDKINTHDIVIAAGFQLVQDERVTRQLDRIFLMELEKENFAPLLNDPRVVKLKSPTSAAERDDLVQRIMHAAGLM